MAERNCSGVAAAVAAMTRVNQSPPRLYRRPCALCNATNPNFYEFPPAPRRPASTFPRRSFQGGGVVFRQTAWNRL